MSYTPGPWVVKGDGRQVFGQTGGCVADCGTQWADDDDEAGAEADQARGEANALLIARVPEILALIAFAAEGLAADNGITWLKTEARALLAKIGGDK